MFQRLLFHSRSAFSHSPPLRSSSLSPLCRTRLDTLTCPVRTMSGSDDDFSSRPAAKRVRSEQDHSKGDTKAREEKIQGEKNGENGKSGKGEEHHDEDWKKAPPFQIGESWEGWTTKWRSSCWCGKTAFVFCADPLQNKYCHCEDCQRLHGAPFQHASVFEKKNVRLDSSPEWLGFLSAHGEVHPLSSTPTPLPRKTSCRACGSPLFDEGRNMCIAFPPTFEFARTKKELDKYKETGGAERPHGKGEEGGKQIGLPPAFQPNCHIFYERRLVDVKDGLVKWRGMNDDSEQMKEDERP